MAVAGGVDVSVVSRLLRRGADPNASTKETKVSPLMLACDRGAGDAMQRLLEETRTNVDAVDVDGKSALTHLCSAASTDAAFVNAFFDAAAGSVDVDRCDGDGCTPLHRAAAAGNAGVVGVASL
jgi:ankyrin repeat protein